MFILQFVKTILSQGHLTPLPLYVSPVYWAYDYALRVYPVPDMLVVADKYDPFTVTNTDCICINPVRFPYTLQNKTCADNLEFINSFIIRKINDGSIAKGNAVTCCLWPSVQRYTYTFVVYFSSQGSFPRSGFSFKVFYPSNKTVEDR